MNKRWSDAEEAELKRLYIDLNEKNVHKLSAHFDKGYRSVISKLVQLNIYEKPEADSKAIPTVKEMFIRIEQLLEIRIDGNNLLKKENLYTLVQALEKKLGDND